ncbi:Gfo/Idh/MocA family protein [Streptomyces tubercidicus]|uniref:Gfo/Idh/MocA family protein n=1 Tax=Streptomyces tubercidicus TaxID=47759 RepID=UPI0034653693
MHHSEQPHSFITGALNEPMDRPLSIAILGAGARGTAYAEVAARRPAQARIVAVAEPRPRLREAFAARHGITEAACFATWQEFAARPRMADIAVISVMDADHVGAATALADLGYQLLLEKPMATTEADCEAIAEAVRRNNTTLAVGHVIRYTPYTVALKQLIATGQVGDIVSVQHLEPVGYYHFAHSFVRGNWRREAASTFLLMSKSCHDIDWLSYLIERPVRRVSSFGSLSHFRPDQAPPGAGHRCISCPVEESCAYSAKRMYVDGLLHGGTKWYFTEIMSEGELTREAVDKALAEGPYGRCVYGCDNDVVDHQVVNLEYEGGVTASFTLTAFTPVEHRRTKIFGTRGQVTGDGRFIEFYDFRTEQTTVLDTLDAGPSAADGHGGGDEGLFHAFLDALHSGRPNLILSGLEDSLDSHRVVFAAERARREGTVVELAHPTAHEPGEEPPCRTTG